MKLFAVPAAALPSPEELCALAFAGDVPAIEAAFDEAHAAFQSGDLPGDELRATTKALMASHPDIVAFAASWLAAEPDSSHAHAVMAFQLEDEAFRLRGIETVAWTYPDALAAFDSRIADAMDLALQAVRLAPDHPPAIDAVMDLQVYTKELPRSGFDAFVQRSMEATHDRGVFLLSAGVTLPQWDGQGAPEVAQLCETYAPLVEGVEGYTPEVCLADVISYTPSATSAPSPRPPSWIATPPCSTPCGGPGRCSQDRSASPRPKRCAT